MRVLRWSGGRAAVTLSEGGGTNTLPRRMPRGLSVAPATDWLGGGARVGEHLHEKGRNLCGATLDVTVFNDSFPPRKLSTTLPASQVDAVLQCS